MMDPDVPIVLAPMAGGPSTPALSDAVAGAGGVGALAFGYLTAEAAQEQLRAVKQERLAVNLFVPDHPTVPEITRPYIQRLRAGGIEHLDEPRFDDDAWADKLDIVAAAPPAAVSFTFGCPTRDVIARLQRAGSEVWVTVTTQTEARDAAHAGADRLIVQGAEAGGHRGSWVDKPDSVPIGLLSLLQLVRHVTDLPLVAAGGIATPEAVRAVLAAGATYAAAGTAFLLAPEAGTAAPHRAVIGSGASTALTRAFTGRLARGVVNPFMTEFGEFAPIAYPEIHHATAALRRKAREEGDPTLINLWAGQAHALTKTRPAAKTVRALAA